MSGSSKFIKQIRKKLNVSQEQFGKKIGYSRSYVRDVESGKAQPSRSFLEKMSMEFNISVDSLLDIDPILTIIDQYRDSDYIAIPYLTGFTQKALDDIEKDLKKNTLAGRDAIFVDGSVCNTPTQLFQALMNEKGDISQLGRKLVEKLTKEDTEIMFVIKTLSKSKLSKKAEHITDIFKIMHDAWDIEKSRSSGCVVTKHLKSSLILIDFPSFLEKNYSKMGLYTIPVLVDPMDLFMKQVTITKEGVVRLK